MRSNRECVMMLCLCTVGCCLVSGCLSRVVVIHVSPSEAVVSLDGERVDSDSTDSPPSENKDSPSITRKLKWSSKDVHAIMGEADGYERTTLTLDAEQAKAAPKPWDIYLELPPLVKEVEIDISANVEEATVVVDDVIVGKTPLRHNFTFTRENSRAPWSTHQVVVTKEGYRYRPPEVDPLPGVNPPFSHQLTLNSPYVKQGRMGLRYFEVYRYVRVPFLQIIYRSDGALIEEETVLSQIGEIEREPKAQSVTRITDADPDNPLWASEIAVMPDGDRIVYSCPFVQPVSCTPCSNIWMQRGSELTRLTDAEKLDIDATVSQDGKWIYFSSNRLSTSRHNLWRIGTEGRGGLTKITDSPSAQIDAQPAISPDGQRLAYMSILKNVEQPHIWVANADGTLPTQLRVGHSPSWSPDGQKLVFAAKDQSGRDRIWVMDADGSNPTQLTSGDYHDRYPVWTPDGNKIVYSSNQGLQEEGVHNFDLWIMSADGSGKTQLTINGSLDSRPAVSSDGRYIYFISNRGALKEGQQSLQIWRIELLDEDVAQQTHASDEY